MATSAVLPGGSFYFLVPFAATTAWLAVRLRAGAVTPGTAMVGVAGGVVTLVVTAPMIQRFHAAMTLDKAMIAVAFTTITTTALLPGLEGLLRDAPRTVYRWVAVAGLLALAAGFFLI